MTTDIEWTRGDDGSPGMTWNPTTGCDRVSAGCDNCYAMTMAKRLKGMGQAKYQRDGDPRTSGPGFGLTIHDDVLTLPLKWRKPRRVFVNSMSDLFHKDVPTAFIAQVWAIMAATPRHTYQILTKRHGRMRSLLTDDAFHGEVAGIASGLAIKGVLPSTGFAGRSILPNVWIGVSVEDQKAADLRVPALLETPAAVRFLSCEPLIGQVDLKSGWFEDRDPLHWVIIGGESGPGARPLDLQWIRNLIADANTLDADVFVKQLGSVWARENGWGGNGGDPEQWPADLQVRQFPISGVTV